jgi:hypothetical protein
MAEGNISHAGKARLYHTYGILRVMKKGSQRIIRQLQVPGAGSHRRYWNYRVIESG